MFTAAAKTVWLFAFAGAMIDAVRSGTGADFGLPDVIWTTWIYVAVLGCCGLAVLISAGSADGARAPRWLLGVGMVGYAPGQALYTQIVAHQASATFPTLADYGWLAFYPCALCAVFLIVRGSLVAVRRVALLDALVGALTMLAMGSVVVVNLALQGNGLHGGQVGNIVYSFADLVMAGIALGTFALFGWRPPRVLALLALGFLVQTVEDTLYLHDVARGLFPTEGWVLVPWLASFVVISAAAVFGRSRRSRKVNYESTATAVAPVAFALVLVAVTVAIMSESTPWVGAIAVDGCALVAVVSRMGLTLRSNVTLLREARDDSITDQLTGLGNRRALLETAQNATDLAMTGGPRLIVALYDLDGFKAYNDSYGHAAGDALLRRLSTRLCAAVTPPAQAFRLGGDEFCVLIPADAGDPGAVVLAAADALTEVGEAFVVANSYGTATIPGDGELIAEALGRADERMYAVKQRRPMRVQANTFGLLRRVLQEIDPDVRVHQTEVARLAAATGSVLGMDQKRIAILAHAAEFHDIGKIAIPESILSKPGPLDEDEWVYMRRHPLIGERILRAAAGMEEVAAIVRSSHERLDGRGYPDGLTGTAFPLEARIVSVCDAFDAMISNRSYRAGISVDDALAELGRCAGSQFDPEVVRALSAVALRSSEPDAELALAT
jgi:two-component system cell cycle response regulator